jgi:hypothetical protein
MRLTRRSIKQPWFIRTMIGIALLLVIICLLIFLRRAQTLSTPQVTPAEQQQRKERDIKQLSFARTIAGLVLLLVVICALIFWQVLQWLSAPQAMLPGQQLWRQGVSSYLFGTNDTYEYSSRNIQTEPAIQRDLRAAGFTLMRSFFPDGASDAVIEQNIHTIENSGARCLAVITNIFHVAYDEHLVRYLNRRCVMYEFGNESDYNNISINSYLKQWNTLIPLLRRINPAAKFIGPVTYNYLGMKNYMREFLEGVKTSGVLPDAISFHWYPCFWDSPAKCLAKASSYGPAAREVQDMVHSILGRDLPVGISEWNFDADLPPPAYGDNAAFITAFTNDALRSMAQAGVAFACQFDAASYSGYGHLDMFQVDTARPKPQFYAIKALIEQYRPSTPLPLRS